MKIKARHPISIGSGANKQVIAKGTEGYLKAVSNAPMIREAFPLLEHKEGGWFYIVKFPGAEEFIVTQTQIDFIS